MSKRAQTMSRKHVTLKAYGVHGIVSKSIIHVWLFRTPYLYSLIGHILNLAYSSLDFHPLEIPT